MMAFSSRANRKKAKAEKKKAPVFQIPYDYVYENGMIEKKGPDKYSAGTYSMVYRVGDALPEKVLSTNPQSLRNAVVALTDGFPCDVTMQYYVVNRKTSPVKFLSRALIPEKKGFENTVNVVNDVIEENAAMGHNNMSRDTFVVFSVKADFPQEAANRFTEIEKRAKELFADVCGIRLSRGTPIGRLHMIYDACNPGKNAFGAKVGMTRKDFSLEDLKYMKLSTKAVVIPDTVEEKKDHLVLNGNHFVRVLFICNLPSAMSENLITDLTSVSSTMIYSALYQPLSSDEGFRITKNEVSANTEVQKRQDRTTLADRKSGKMVTMSDARNKSEKAYFENAALGVMSDAKASGTKTFLSSFLIVLYSDSMENLEKDTQVLTLAATKYAFQIKTLDFQQKKGLISALPLAQCNVDVTRVFTAEKLSALNPVDVRGSLRVTGAYAGVNAINDNMILLNRRNSPIPSGIITGMRNAGKTWQVKRGIFGDLVTTDDVVFLIAVKKEKSKYDPFTEKMHGVVFEGGSFDPFRTTNEYGVVDSGKALKTELLTALMSAALDFKSRLAEGEAVQAEERLIREVRTLAEKDFSAIEDASGYIVTHAAAFPYLFDAMERLPDDYVHGKNRNGGRFNVFYVNDAASLLIVLDRIWGMMIGLKKQNISASVYVDSADELIWNSEGNRYLQMLLAKANILQDPITLVVQNSALFGNAADKAKLTGLFPQVGYYKLLSQGPIERSLYTDTLNIQPSLVPYITNSGVGRGIIVSNHMTVPFNDNAEETATNAKAFRAVFD